MTKFIRRRILRVFPFVTTGLQPHTDSIPGCFIRPQTLTPRTGAQQH